MKPNTPSTQYKFISAEDLFRYVVPQNSHSGTGYTISNAGQNYSQLYKALILESSARRDQSLHTIASAGTTVSGP
jgi:hypothetical protein